VSKSTSTGCFRFSAVTVETLANQRSGSQTPSSLVQHNDHASSAMQWQRTPTCNEWAKMKNVTALQQQIFVARPGLLVIWYFTMQAETSLSAYSVWTIISAITQKNNVKISTDASSLSRLKWSSYLQDDKKWPSFVYGTSYEK